MISPVDLGPGKGVFSRLKVRPMTSPASARTLCNKLKARKLFCQRTSIKAG